MRSIFIIPFLFACILLVSCEDFIEADLSKKQMTVLSPADNSVSPGFTQTFWWEDLKGADQYQIQIVKPSFAAIQEFIADTTVSASRLALTLSPGTYQWRIRAKNGSSATGFITRTLTIDSTLNLSGQTLILSAPANNFYSNHFLNTFTWQTLPNAESYILQILESGSVIQTQTLTSISSSYTFGNEGAYQWRVFAQNSNSNSAYSIRSITIDTTRPGIPLVLFPLTDTVTSASIPLGWSISESGCNSHVQISHDSTFASVIKDTLTAAASYTIFSPLTGQYYYWRVKAVDAALNESAYCIKRKVKKN